MGRRFASVVMAGVLVASAAGAAGASDGDGRTTPSPPTPGAPGLDDPYYPLDGNGGYDVDEYHLSIRYDPATDELRGSAAIEARATQSLSSFNLDLVGLTVRSVTVDGAPAEFQRDGNELTIVPSVPLDDGAPFRVVVRYHGIPGTDSDPVLGGVSGFIHTDDGALVVGQPHVASAWFPVNDHPSDAASYRMDITVPEGLEAVANGVLTDQQTRKGWTTWSWEAAEPMASYLATATIGDFELDAYAEDGIEYWDAVDPDLLAGLAPHTGEGVLVSQAADLSYKRLTRTIAVPPEGATLSFWVAGITESDWDYFFVEARTPDGSDWTTLPEASGLTSTSTGASCPLWFDFHPALANYQTADGPDSCSPTGETGEWNAASGGGLAWTQWTIDLSDYVAAGAVEISLAYASDDTFQDLGVVVDDIEVSTGEGSTSFEDDDDPLDGWVVAGPPADSPGNDNDWIVGTQADMPPPPGDIISPAFARQPEIIDFLAGYFGEYPFSAAGGIVDDLAGINFALENQTRPIYGVGLFTDQVSAEAVVVHELAHQWYGNDARLGLWQDIWLNEGFATYAEWLWSEYEGLGSPQETFDLYMDMIPADDPFWTVTIGDPGPDGLFDIAVYYRGAMTLHALRLAVGDDTFFDILRTWADQQSGDTVSTPEFIALAEQMSGEELDELFETWLYTPSKPEVAEAEPGIGSTDPSAPPVISTDTEVGATDPTEPPVISTDTEVGTTDPTATTTG